MVNSILIMLFLLAFVRLSVSECDCETFTKKDENGLNVTCDGRINTQDATKSICLPYAKCCAIDDSFFNQRYISVGYKIIFRENVSNVQNEKSVLRLNGSITFTQDALNVTAPNGLTLEGPCPLLIFEDISQVTIDDVTINCTSATGVASGILIKNVGTLNVNMQGIHVSGKAKSAVTVLGGQFDITVPITSSNMTGSSFHDIVLSKSSYRFNVDLVIALFYGYMSINDVGRLLVQPSIDPSLNYPTPLSPTNQNANSNSKKTRIYNFSEWTKIIGRDYEVILNDPHGTLGYSTVEYEDEQMQIFKIALTVLAGCVILISIRFVGPVSYLYKLAKTP